MTYQERFNANVAQKLENELKVRTLEKSAGKALTLRAPGDFGLNPNPNPFRLPFLFVPNLIRNLSALSGPNSILNPSSFLNLTKISNILANFPLKLEIAPESITYNYRKQIQRDRTLAGFVEYHWGEELDEISAQGSTGGFVNSEAGLSENIDRRVSFSYINYEAMLQLYKNNGAIFDSQGRVMVWNKMYLLYDIGIYKGYFTNFNVTETATSPFRFTINWSFRIDSVMHLFTSSPLIS